MKYFPLWLIISGFFFPAGASALDFTYNSSGAEIESFGFNKPEIYDIAIYLSGSDLVGKSVTGFTVPFTSDLDKAENFSGWLTTELTEKNEGQTSVNVPQLSVPVSFIDDNTLSVVFDTPYVIPEEGLYVGYSFTMTQVGEEGPVAVVGGRNSNGFMLHSSSTQKKWADYSKRKSLISAMTVYLEGDFAEDAAVCTLNDNALFSTEAPIEISVTVINHGLRPISSVDYTYNVDEIEETGTYIFDNPIPAVFGRAGIFGVEIPPLSRTGETPFKLTIDRVNSCENSSLDSHSADLVGETYLFIPVKRPLVEEYTGLKCGWCPRGYVMLEQGKLYYGDRFVGLSYHSTAYESPDQMCCINEADFPVHNNGYPYVSVNRGQGIDPYNVLPLWETSSKEPASCSVDVSLDWADENHDRIKATAETRFLYSSSEHDYRLSFAVLADGLCKSSWLQTNAYSSYKAEGKYCGPFWDLFIGQSENVSGLVFNDVVIYYPDITGIEGSLPDVLTAGDRYEYTFEFGLSDLVNLAGQPLVDNFNNIRVVAVVLNNGLPSNCVSSGYVEQSGVQENTSYDYVVSTAYYDLQGYKISKPDKGFCICEEIMSSGTRRITKVVM